MPRSPSPQPPGSPAAWIQVGGGVAGGQSRWLLALILAGLLLPARECPATLVVEIGLNFTGSRYPTDVSGQPADANGTVGPSHFVEFINGRYAVYDKRSGARLQSMTDLAFWRSAGVTLSTQLVVTDPRLVFDRLSQRWFASQIDFDPSNQVSNRFLLGVSTSSDPLGSWKGFAFRADPVQGSFADFPTLGVDARGVYLSGDLFDAAGNGLGPTLVAVPKNDLLASPPTIAGRTSFGLLSYGTRGEILQPVVSLDADSIDERVLAMGDLGYDGQPHSNLVVFAVQNAAVSSGATLTTSAMVPVPPYTVPINPPQPGGYTGLDDGDARLSATVYRVGGVVYAVHNVEVGSRAALQWFRLDATNFTLLQSGTISDPTLDLFYPSIAANESGVAVITCNGSSSSSFVSAYALAGETVGGTLTFGPLRLLQAGTASFNDPDPTDPSSVSRWGDYSTTSVDPSDPGRFWTIQMIPSGRQEYLTQVTALRVRPLTLTITPLGANLLITWPAAATGFALETSGDLGRPGGWSAVPQTAVLEGDLLTVTLPTADHQGFFRLAGP